ncbi:MAG: glycosyltransferase family 4 protein, partial [Planctomycetota bacterium]
MSGDRHFVLVANTKLPSQRAMALQVVQSCAAFQRAGWASTLLVADRRRVAPLPGGADLFDYYGVPAGARPAIERAPCVDLIERVPVALQYVPSRMQELSFARNAARIVMQRHASALVLARELEVGRWLARAGKRDFLLEIHRVPGGRLRRRWLREAAHAALGTIAISGGVRGDLLALGLCEADILVEHDALEPQRFANMPTRQAARAALGLAEKDPVIVYTGGLLTWKGVELLVDAARELPTMRFVIAESMDADVARLRERAEGQANVRIDGFQEPERVSLYLAAADIGVVPNRSQPAISSRYTSPLKVFESFAAGLPLVASDLPSLRELLADGLDAVLVKPDDASALARG